MRAFMLIVIMLVLITAQALAVPVTRKYQVDGVERTAIIFPGSKARTATSPVVLAFHGFGGTAAHMAERMAKLQKAWPEATVVYPQGLPVASSGLKRTAPGWQKAPGVDKDRDVHFIDTLLPDLIARYKVDERRIYVTGMSNGALFTFLLLTVRPEKFAAFAPVAGACGFVRTATVPRPVIMINGTQDTLVRFSWAEGTRDILRRLNGCGENTVEWAPGYHSYQPCTSGQPLIFHAFDGGHSWPPDATTHIVQFFKEQALPERNTTRQAPEGHHE